MINIKGLNKAEILASLYNASNERKNMKPSITTLEVNNLMQTTMIFDYVYGVTIKMNMLSDNYNEVYYDLVNGVGSALEVIDKIRFNDNDISRGLNNKDEKEELMKMKFDLEKVSPAYHISYVFR